MVGGVVAPNKRSTTPRSSLGSTHIGSSALLPETRSASRCPFGSIVSEGKWCCCTGVVIVAELETTGGTHLVRRPSENVLVRRCQGVHIIGRPVLVWLHRQLTRAADRTTEHRYILAQRSRPERQLGATSGRSHPLPGRADRTHHGELESSTWFRWCKPVRIRPLAGE